MTYSSSIVSYRNPQYLTLIIFIERYKVWRKKELEETPEQRLNRQMGSHMIKQPLLRFDIIWRKLTGKSYWKHFGCFAFLLLILVSVKGLNVVYVLLDINRCYCCVLLWKGWVQERVVTREVLMWCHSWRCGAYGFCEC